MNSHSFFYSFFFFNSISQLGGKRKSSQLGLAPEASEVLYVVTVTINHTLLLRMVYRWSHLESLQNAVTLMGRGGVDAHRAPVMQSIENRDTLGSLRAYEKMSRA